MILAHNGYVYCEIWKGMYGLPQSGILANQKLVQRLEPKDYALFKHPPGLWRYKWIPTTFSLVVDNFGVKYAGKQHSENLVQTTKGNYQVSTDWEGQRYSGIRIKRSYQKGVLNVSM